MHSQPALLVQRTTPRKVGRRLIVGMPSDEFYVDYPRYFLENHVNYIKVRTNEDKNLLYGLMGWLNSDLINFVFQLRNGNTHVSAFELGLFPVNLEMVKQLVDQTKTITKAKIKNGMVPLKSLTKQFMIGWILVQGIEVGLQMF